MCVCTYSSHELGVEGVENVHVEVSEVNVRRQVSEGDSDDETIGHASGDTRLIRLHVQYSHSKSLFK